MSQILAIILSIAYLISAYIADGWAMVIKALIFVIFANLLIWFSEEMGDYIGNVPWITRESHGIMVKILGWVVLLSPILIGIIIFISEKI